jgi:TRAP-type C4-dicarboxylate transport system permease small subunit
LVVGGRGDGLRRAVQWIGLGLDVASGALMAVIAILVAAQVAVRYVLGGSLVWSEELTRLLFVWMILLAATRAAPMRIDVIVSILPARLGALCALVTDVIVFGLTCTLVWGAWGMAELTAGDSYIAIDISVSWAYVALVLAGTLWLLRTIGEAAGHLAQVFGRPGAA